MSDWLSPAEWQAVALSLKVAFWATLLSLPVGILVALALARGRFWGHALLNGAVYLPLILPPVVTGYLLLLAFGHFCWNVDIWEEMDGSIVGDVGQCLNECKDNCCLEVGSMIGIGSDILQSWKSIELNITTTFLNIMAIAREQSA